MPSPHRIPEIRGVVARAMLISAVLLSLLFGGAVFLYDGYRAVGGFYSLATQAAVELTEKLVEHSREHPAGIDQDTLTRFLTARHQVQGGHFISIRVINDQGATQSSAIADRFRKPSLDLADEAQAPPHWELRMDDGELFILVVQAMRNPAGHELGRFHGLFHIEAQTIRQVVGASLETVALTVLIVLLTTTALYPIITRLHHALAVRSDELVYSHMSLLQSLGNAIAKRDSDTHPHNFRVTFYAVRLAEAAALPAKGIASLIKGAFLHDLGKIAISDSILLKPGRLTEEEMTVMKTHVKHGLDMIQNAPWLADAMDVVGGHHERWDGAGYPRGIKGNAIPINARIFAIVLTIRPSQSAYPEF